MSKKTAKKRASKTPARVERKTKKRVVKNAPGKKRAKKKTAVRKAVKKVAAKKKMGRPTRYQQKFADELPPMFKNGESVAEVCVMLEICKDTFYAWVEKYPDFSDAYKKGRELSEAWWHKIGRANATGRMRGSAATWIFNMKNRFDWTDKTEMKSQVNIREAGIGVEDDMDEDDWNDAAARQQAIMKGTV